MRTVIPVPKSDPWYPDLLKSYPERLAPESLFALGNLNILKHEKLGLFCSVKCPGNLILQTYDLARSMRDGGVTVIGGFHSPMERECLHILLRGSQPIVMCPARSVHGMRVKQELGQPLLDGRLLILSAFPADCRRATKETASFRNRFLAALADKVFVSYADPGGKVEQLCHEIISWNKPLYTLGDPSNANLIEMGARPVKPDDLEMLR